MQLRSGTPFWRVVNPELLHAPRLTENLDCEVLVLGSGVSGALAAYYLALEGVDVVLLDKRKLSAGSTAASTGLLQYEVDTHLSELSKRVGEKNAVHAYRRGLTAIDEIEKLCREFNDPCGFARRDSLYFASNKRDYAELKREFELRLKYGFDVQFLERHDLSKIGFFDAPGAILSQGDGQIDIYRFTQLVLKHAQAKGLRIFAETNVENVDERQNDVVATTPRATVTARRIVYAAGYDSEKYLGYKVGDLNSTYAVVSEPLASYSGWPRNCLIWETSRPYFYARQTEDGRAMIGGEDTEYSTDHQRDELVERQVARLLNRFAKLFPAIDFQPSCAWAGTFGETKDGLAFIGQPQDRPLAYFAVGFGGNGITFSMIAAQAIVDLYKQRPNADADVFGFERGK